MLRSLIMNSDSLDELAAKSEALLQPKLQAQAEQKALWQQRQARRETIRRRVPWLLGFIGFSSMLANTGDWKLPVLISVVMTVAGLVGVQIDRWIEGWLRR